MTEPQNTTEELALAIEHMKVDQLTKLQAHTDAQRKAYALIGHAAIELNKVLLKKLYALEHGVIHSDSIVTAHDKTVNVRMFAYREMEKLENEWKVQCNGESAAKDPRKVGTISGLYVGDGTVNEHTGFNRDSNS